MNDFEKQPHPLFKNDCIKMMGLKSITGPNVFRNMPVLGTKNTFLNLSLALSRSLSLPLSGGRERGRGNWCNQGVAVSPRGALGNSGWVHVIPRLRSLEGTHTQH